ncbi:DMT family transporter [Marinimicrococcus flavescens]|uniref:DMT family transporter n=1 Tax=Marinimicrococcus flavescens TaxID=3031815 RepID=A0AAP3XRF3_9PROT|nr:DMT family transporter [Marinimicrococcus flavescens]
MKESSGPLAATGTDNVRGALWILASCLLFATMSALAKIAGERLHSFEVSFFRAFFGFVLLLPLILRAGPGVWRTSRLHLHITRGTVGSLGLLFGFYAVTHMPLAEATALGFTKPLFQVLLAAFALREVVRMRRWVATAVGFLGVLVMLRPDTGNLELAALAGLAGALCGATVSVTLRHMVRLERELTILAWLGVVGTVVTGLPALFVWQTPTPGELGLLLCMAAVGTVSQVCLMRGFRVGEASAMAPIDYSRLPLSAFYGVILFAEWLDPLAILGAAIIAGSTLYIARREAALARQGRA